MPGRKAIGPTATQIAGGSLVAERVHRSPDSGVRDCLDSDLMMTRRATTV